MKLVAKTEFVGELHTHPPDDVRPGDWPYYTDRKSLVLTIRGKDLLIDQLPFEIQDDVLGLLEVFPLKVQRASGTVFSEIRKPYRV